MKCHINEQADVRESIIWYLCVLKCVFKIVMVKKKNIYDKLNTAWTYKFKYSGYNIQHIIDYWISMTFVVIYDYWKF